MNINSAIILLMVSSTGILVKKDSTSYETSSYLPELVKLFIKSGRVNVSLIANSFLDKALRYFASPLEALYIKCRFDQLSNKVLDAQHLFLILY